MIIQGMAFTVKKANDPAIASSNHLNLDQVFTTPMVASVIRRTLETNSHLNQVACAWSANSGVKAVCTLVSVNQVHRIKSSSTSRDLNWSHILENTRAPARVGIPTATATGKCRAAPQESACGFRKAITVHITMP